MRISDWSSDVCSSDLNDLRNYHLHIVAHDRPAKFLSEFGQWDFEVEERYNHKGEDRIRWPHRQNKIGQVSQGSKKTGVENSGIDFIRSEEHTSELQSLMRISYAVFCLKKKTTQNTTD